MPSCHINFKLVIYNLPSNLAFSHWSTDKPCKTGIQPLSLDFLNWHNATVLNSQGSGHITRPVHWPIPMIFDLCDLLSKTPDTVPYLVKISSPEQDQLLLQ